MSSTCMRTSLSELIQLLTVNIPITIFFNENLDFFWEYHGIIVSPHISQAVPNMLHTYLLKNHALAPPPIKIVKIIETLNLKTIGVIITPAIAKVNYA